MRIIEKIESEQLKNGRTAFRVGDNVKVHTRVVEGNKERIQIFAGIVIARKGSGVNENFTVRRISFGEGVERVFPIHSPKVERIEVTREGNVRRAKLHYLRGRKGKEALFVDERVSLDAKGKAKKKAAAAEAEASQTNAPIVDAEIVSEQKAE
jgi:large subunit ribosomal protein L19